MKYKIACSFFLIALLLSCKNDDQKRASDNQKSIEKRKVIFSKINKGWVFNDSPINTATEGSMATWNELRLFLAELSQKPKKTIEAFQDKSKAISKKVMALRDNIPPEFDKPQIKARISTLITKVRLLDLFIHLDNIPEEKVVRLVAEINLELISLERQMDKIVEKSKIPLEEGESELMKMMDTARAIPNVIMDPNLPRVE